MQRADNPDMHMLLAKAAGGNDDALNAMVKSNLGLVHSVVKRFVNKNYERDDLFQIGCVGLIKAIKKFDLSYGVQFSTYAVPVIMGEIRAFLRDDGLIKVSRGLKETANRARKTKETLTNELGREPSISELAGKMGLNPGDLVMAMDAVCAPESLFKTYGEDSDTEMIEHIDNNQNKTSEIIDKLAIAQAIGTLNPRERQIIVLRYFKSQTQSDVAKLLGISQVQVSRIEKKVLLNMRSKMTS